MSQLRITAIEEAEWPAPARVLGFDEIWDRKEEIWERILPAMDDFSNDPAGFFRSIYEKQTVLIEWGLWDGLIWVYHLQPGEAATMSCVFWGDWRVFSKTFGPPREAQREVVRWIMDSFELRKLRGHIGSWNKKSWKLAERLGFQREGVLRGEQKIGGEYHDLLVYGVLREEI